MTRYSCLAMIALLSATAALPAAAQDPFEIQVYEYETVPRGRWDLETHVNYTARGIRAFDAGVAPSQGQTHLTFELTRGITNYFELAGYLVTAHRDGAHRDRASLHVRMGAIHRHFRPGDRDEDVRGLGAAQGAAEEVWVRARPGDRGGERAAGEVVRARDQRKDGGESH